MFVLIVNLSNRNINAIKDGLKQKLFNVDVVDKLNDQHTNYDIVVVLSDNIRIISSCFLKLAANNIPSFFIIPSMIIFVQHSKLLPHTPVYFAELSWLDTEIVERICTFAMAVNFRNTSPANNCFSWHLEIPRKQCLLAIQDINYYINLSMIDELTGVYNKRYLKYFTKNYHNSLICMIDIDNFKLINDTIGHINADKVLQELASIIKHEISHEDKVIRFGGDEFIIIIRDLNIEKARCLAENIKNKIVKKYINSNIRPTISYGISTCKNVKDVINAIDIADKNMYSYRYNNAHYIINL